MPSIPQCIPCAKPENAIIITMDGPDRAIYKPIFLGEISELIPIVARDATACTKPHDTIWVGMDG